MFKSIREQIAKTVSENRKVWDKRNLEKKLSNLVSVAESHKSLGLPSGHKYFKMIWTEAQKSIDQYCANHKTSFDSIAMSVPPLREMESLSEGKKDSSLLGKVVVFILGSASLTVLIALLRNLFVWVTK